MRITSCLRTYAILWAVALAVNVALLSVGLVIHNLSPQTTTRVGQSVAMAYEGRLRPLFHHQNSPQVAAASTDSTMTATEVPTATSSTRFSALSLAGQQHQSMAAQSRRPANVVINGINCTHDEQCGNGICREAGTPMSYCRCDCFYIADPHDAHAPCAYEQRSQRFTWLLSFTFGILGADWFYLADGHVGYNVAGAFKLVSAGGCLVWSTVDWARILCKAFPDGNGVSLYNDFT